MYLGFLPPLLNPPLCLMGDDGGAMRSYLLYLERWEMQSDEKAAEYCFLRMLTLLILSQDPSSLCYHRLRHYRPSSRVLRNPQANE